MLSQKSFLKNNMKTYIKVAHLTREKKSLRDDENNVSFYPKTQCSPDVLTTGFLFEQITQSLHVENN